MRKSILLLINGFGIEKKGSFEIYNSALMPNFDNLIKTSLFSSLISPVGDYNNGYKLFGVKENNKNKEDKIDDLIFEKKLGKNEVLNEINTVTTNPNKLHIFYTLDKENKVGQIKEFLRILNPNKDKNVFIHLVLMSENVDDYDNISKILSKVSFEMGGYAKVGIVIGKNKINTDDMLRTFYKEFGERWNESNKKIDILKKDIVNPMDANVFYINTGFALSENDTLFFLNYSNLDVERFLSEITKMPLKVYSLYNMRDDVKNVFTKDISSVSSLTDTLEKFNIKMLTLTSPNTINDVNFYFNGMQKKLSPNIYYAKMDLGLFATKESVIDLIDNNPFDGYILDFNIGGFITTQDIRDTLSKIDKIVGTISEASKEKNYTFIISSLYGMHAEVMDGVVPKVVNFNGKVPCIFYSNEFTKSEYALNSGDIEALRDTFLTNICDDVKQNKLVHKLSSLEKMLSKK